MLQDLLTKPIEEIDEFSKPEGNQRSNTGNTVKAYLRGMGVDINHVKEEEVKKRLKTKLKK